MKRKHKPLFPTPFRPTSEVLAAVLDFPETWRVLKQSPPEQGRCYNNCLRAMTLPGYERAIYVEGVANSGNMVAFAHGWLVHKGKLIDPTGRADAYFPALQFSPVWITSLCHSLKRTPFFDAFGPDVMAAVTKQAREAAAAAARKLQEQFRQLAEYQGIPWPQ